MELCIDILQRVLQSEQIAITFPDLKIDAQAIIEMECYKALNEIKRILENNSLNDSDCFQRIEEIVCALEQLGSGCGTRHDF